MKFTSEDLLNAMGLKDGNYITFEDDTRLFEVVSEEKELYLVCDFKKFNFFNKTLNKNFVIIQPKPTLTEDEKAILIILGRTYKNFVRERNGKFTECFPKLFNNLEYDKIYSIEELLKEN